MPRLHCIQRISRWYNSAQFSIVATDNATLTAGSKENARMPDTRSRLRKLLNGPEMVIAPFVYDCLQARLAQHEGFKAIYMTGFGTAAARGFPDLGLLTMGEMVENVRALARSVDIPLICDADTGYGEAINVQRTVREYEDAGAAALHIEDQVWPKRCGFLEGKQVIPLENMTAKLRAAIDARRDPNLVIIARTDALAPLGWEEVTRRARAYRAAGADLIFVDGIKTLEDLKNCARLLSGTATSVQRAIAASGRDRTVWFQGDDSHRHAFRHLSAHPRRD